MSPLERLSSARASKPFICGNDDLDVWFRDASETADRAGAARVYVSLDDNGEVIGYFAIVPHVVRRQDLPTSVGRGSPEVIPSFLLARLALSKHLHGHGRGGELLAEALTTILAAISVGGGRMIVVDAIDDRAAMFYEHFGFSSVPENPNRLVMKASTAAASLDIEWP